MNAQGWGIPDLGVVDDSQLGGPAAHARPPPTTGTCCCSARPTPAGSPTPSAMPGALIEPLFITDPYEASIAESAAGQEVIAGGLAQAVEQYFERARHRGRQEGEGLTRLQLLTGQRGSAPRPAES